MQEEALRWVEARVTPAGPIELAHDKPWSRVWKVPLADDDAAWFKVCAPVQAFEPRLTAALHGRWPDRIVDVIAHDEERAWLLLADGGTPVGAYGNAPDAWAAALPLYAELQRGEVEHVGAHLDGGVTDRRLERLPALYEDMLRRELPLEPEECEVLRRFARVFAELCRELEGPAVPETVQHDDLHIGNVYAKDERMLILDWGDASMAHPFFSLARGGDEWPARLRRAYLEPWGPGLDETLELALRVGSFAYVFGFLRLWDHLDETAREHYRAALPRMLRRAVASAA
ncbi:MAG TPA: phosphotransferase [Gaiellaceae bacterium]|nr:phosphotransferase [Gaiellaceae bacterium]